MVNLYRNIPKLELHAHLNGSISDDTLLELYKQKGLSDKYDRLSAIISNEESRTLSECFDLFNFIYTVTDNLESIRKITYDVIRDFYEDGVVYLELRTTPRCIENVMTKDEYIRTVVETIEKLSIERPEITVKLIISLNRKETLAQAKETIDLAIKYRRSHRRIVCGVDVSGDPTKGSWFKELLSEARQNGLKTAIHAAEVPNHEETDDILNFKPDRIGHGTCIHESFDGSNELWEKLLESKIPIECCLTSNVKTKTVASYSDHHFKYLVQEKHPVVICTDDKGVFSTSLSKEIQHAANYFNLNIHDVWELNYRAIDYSFADDREKDTLKQILLKWKEEI